MNSSKAILSWYELSVSHPDQPLQSGALCIRGNVRETRMLNGRTVSVTRTVRPKEDKEKTIVIRYPKGCCKYREELLPINRVQEISTWESQLPKVFQEQFRQASSQSDCRWCRFWLGAGQRTSWFPEVPFALFSYRNCMKFCNTKVSLFGLSSSCF